MGAFRFRVGEERTVRPHVGCQTFELLQERNGIKE